MWLVTQRWQHKPFINNQYLKMSHPKCLEHTQIPNIFTSDGISLLPHGDSSYFFLFRCNPSLIFKIHIKIFINIKAWFHTGNHTMKQDSSFPLKHEMLRPVCSQFNFCSLLPNLWYKRPSVNTLNMGCLQRNFIKTFYKNLLCKWFYNIIFVMMI